MRGTSRAGVVVGFFLAVMFTLYMMLLGAGTLRAQEITSMEGTTTVQATTIIEETTSEDDCADNEELVGSVISGRDDVPETEPFGITGPDFRVVVNAISTAPTNGNVDVNVLDEDGLFVGGAFVSVDPDFFENETESSGVIDGPGTFSLEIDANGASYDIAICQTPGQGGGTNGDDEDTDNDGVIDNTIPRKPLPDTGGSTALMVGGSALLLLYSGLVAWRLKTRKR